MEIEFLFKLNWQAYVGPHEFMDEWIKIENLVIKNECKKRSYQFITYGEIMRIFENDKVYQRLVSNFLKFISKFIFIASFTYSSVILGLVLLSRSTMMQNGLQTTQNHQNLINQTYYGDYSNAYSTDQSNAIDKEDEDVESDLNGDEESIEKLNSELSSKTLNLNKLNSLDLNELNNRLNIMSRLDQGVALKHLPFDIYNIQTNKNIDQKCEFNNNFHKLISTLSNLPVSHHHHENYSDYNFKKELSNSPTIRKLFLEYKIY